MWAPGVLDGVTEGDVIVTADGVRYKLSAHARYDTKIDSETYFTSNVGTPLSNFTEESLRKLEPCWSTSA